MVHLVLDRHIPAAVLPLDGHIDRQGRRFNPIADKQLAGPDGHEGPRGKAVPGLFHADAPAFLAAAVIAYVLAPQRGELLVSGQLVLGVVRRVNRNVSLPAQHGPLTVRQNIDDVQFVPFQLAGAETKANEINQRGEKDDVAGESDPGEHLAVDLLEPVLISGPMTIKYPASSASSQPSGSLRTCLVSIIA